MQRSTTKLEQMIMWGILLFCYFFLSFNGYAQNKYENNHSYYTNSISRTSHLYELQVLAHTISTKTSITDSISSLAEIHLGRLAEKVKEQRQINGVIGLVFGTLIVGAGVATATDPNYVDAGTAGPIVIGIGLIVGGVSIWRLSTPFRAEREYVNVKEISDVRLKERVGSEALISLAEDARNTRTLIGVISGVCSAGFFILRPFTIPEWSSRGMIEKDSPGNDINGLLFAGIAVYSLVVKSSEESALERYEADKKRASSLGIQFGTDSNGSIILGLAYSF